MLKDVKINAQICICNLNQGQLFSAEGTVMPCGGTITTEMCLSSGYTYTGMQFEIIIYIFSFYISGNSVLLTQTLTDNFYLSQNLHFRTCDFYRLLLTNYIFFLHLTSSLSLFKISFYIIFMEFLSLNKIYKNKETFCINVPCMAIAQPVKGPVLSFRNLYQHESVC